MVCLQETHALSSDELSVWFSRFSYLCLGSFGSSSCGVTILYRPVLCGSAVCDFDARFVPVEFNLRDSVFGVACCYAPNRNPDRDAFLHRCIDSHSVHSIHFPFSFSFSFSFPFHFPFIPFIFIPFVHSGLLLYVTILILFSIVLSTVVVLVPQFDTSCESSILLSAFFCDCCMVDIWRLKHPDVPSFT